MLTSVSLSVLPTTRKEELMGWHPSVIGVNFSEFVIKGKVNVVRVSRGEFDYPSSSQPSKNN